MNAPDIDIFCRLYIRISLVQDLLLIPHFVIVSSYMIKKYKYYIKNLFL